MESSKLVDKETNVVVFCFLGNKIKVRGDNT